ncbi:septation protein SepH, partial [Streptomyces sp. NPDC056652]|uniref:septation protein SepH n=1 Tax=Streptomyces sp. NPDC056652 TaxID=3345893 RepID=UPI0036B8A22B
LAGDEVARAGLGHTHPRGATMEPSSPFGPGMAGRPRPRPLDRSLDRQLERPVAPEPDDTSERDSLTSLLEAVPSFRGDMVVPEQPMGPAADQEEEPEAEEPVAPAASAGAGSAYADVLMPRSVAGHRDRLTGTTDRQAEADGVRPGRRAAVPSWDEIVFGTRRKKQD